MLWKDFHRSWCGVPAGKSGVLRAVHARGGEWTMSGFLVGVVMNGVLVINWP